MASEARKGIIRIATNYARLAATFLMAIALVPLLLELVGNEGMGLIALMGSTVGVAAMLSDVVQTTSIRELGAVYHSGDSKEFARTYNSAIALAIAAGVVTLLLFTVLAVFMPFLFQIRDELITPARLFVASQAIRSFFAVTLAPTFNMYQITERMASYNAWLTTDRFSNLAGALLLLVVPKMPAVDAVVWYGFASTFAYIAFMVTAVAILVFGIDRQLLPRLGYVDRGAIRSLINIGGWNIIAQVAMDLHLRLDNYLMNLWFGVEFGNLIFGGLAVTLTSSVRRIANGVTSGLAAVSARLSVQKGEQGVQSLLHHTLRLQASAILPALAILTIIAEPVLQLWVGKRLTDPTGTLMHQSTVLVRLLAIGVCLRGTSDGIVRILYGAGFVRQYAPIIITGGIANPIAAVLFLMLLPRELKYIGPALAYCLLMLLVNAIFLPIRCARLVNMRIYDLYLPMLRPALATLAASSILIVSVLGSPTWSITRLLLITILFSLAYVALVWLIVVTPQERARLRSALRRISGRGRAEEVRA